MEIQEIAENRNSIKNLILKINNLNHNFYLNSRHYYLVYNLSFYIIGMFSIYNVWKYFIELESPLGMVLSFILLFLFGIFGLIGSLAHADHCRSHFVNLIFSNKKNDDSYLLKRYKKYYHYVNKKYSTNINELNLTLNDFENKFLTTYIKKNGTLNNYFFYNYLYSYINENNKETLKENKENILLLIDEIYEEDNQKKLLNMYVKKLQNQKYKSTLVNQFESLLNEKDGNININDIEITKQSLIKQI